MIDSAPGGIWAWFVLWIGWQIVAIVAAIRHWRHIAIQDVSSA